MEELDPLHQVTLGTNLTDGPTVVAPAGSRIAARERTVKEYDTGRPTNGTAKVKNQVTKLTVGAQPRSNAALLGDARVTVTAYDWAKGRPTETTDDPGGLNLVKSSTYDASGKVVKTTLPNSTGSDAGATVTAYYTADGSGPCGGRPEWADSLCRTGGGANPAQLVTKTTEYGTFGQTTKVTETANGVTRLTVTDHDPAARPTTVSVSGGLGSPPPPAATTYDPTTGQPLTLGSPSGGMVTKAYDRLGRVISYTDADGGITTTAYDALNRPLTVTDTAPSTTTYTYDTAVDPRGLTTSVSDSIAGTFAVRYDADGSAASGTLPGGYSMRQVTDPAGQLTGRTYTRDGDGVVIVDDSVTRTIHDQAATHTGAQGGAATQTYGYDAIGRLVKVTDTAADGVCTARGYTLDKNTNRTAQTTAVSTPGADCPTTGGTSVTHAFDTADRIVDPGYVYDAFGRTTAQPGGATTAYYDHDLVRQQTNGTTRQTWTLDAAQRLSR